MRLVAFCLLFSVLLEAGPRANSPFLPVTVLLDFAESRSSVSLVNLQKIFNTVFADSSIQIDLRLKSVVQSEPQVGELLIFKMKGQCVSEALPIGAVSDEGGALAMAYKTDGTILPFGEVQCDRLRASLQRMYGKGQLPAHRADFDLAVAHVMAHEIYHMLASSAAHTRTGVTKERLSPKELVSSDLPFPAVANDALRRALANINSH